VEGSHDRCRFTGQDEPLHGHSHRRAQRHPPTSLVMSEVNPRRQTRAQHMPRKEAQAEMSSKWMTWNRL
jgi:hypothetical protein